jgi:hypothetical protein
MIITFLLPLVTIIGLFAPSFYHDAARTIPQERGQDLITLVVVEPLLVWSLIAARRGAGVVARLVWAGALSYTLYTYMLYSYTAYFNVLFLAYVALFALSAFALASLLPRLDIRTVQTPSGPGRGERAVALFLVLVGMFFALTWLGQIIPATLRGTVPSSILQAKTPSNGVYIQDLGFVIPLLCLAGIWLWRGRAWGAALGAILLVVADIMGAAIVSMALFMAHAGFAGSLGTAGLFTVVTGASVVFTVVHFVNLLPDHSSSARSTRFIMRGNQAG